MARTSTVSDDEIFEAARKVIGRRGADAFTLSEVASDVGLSRAAIILRFKSTHDLKITILGRMVNQFIRLLDDLPKVPGGDHLIAVAEFIGNHAGNQDASASFFSDYSRNLKDTELLALEKRRGDALHLAITNVMPETAVERSSAVIAFRAHLAGSIMAWVASNETDPGIYLAERTREWLRLVGIPFTDKAAVARSREPGSRKARSNKSRASRQ
jgi:TetR/AcrR family macrolide resistance operon transcriptional repressor